MVLVDKLVKIKFLSCLIYTACSAFNLEPRIPIAKQGSNHSLFGLSVAQHYIKESPSSTDDITFLVGAPKAAAASYQSSDLQNPGALYQCSISSKKRCKHVRIDDEGTTFEVNSSNGWLGVTVKSQKPGGYVAVCAHRYTLRGGQAKAVIWEAEVGRCFMLNNRLKRPDFQDTFQPCFGRVDAEGTYSKETYGYCQAGTSFAFADNESEDIAIGLPGSYVWSGDIFSTQISESLFFPDILYSSDGSQNQKINHNSYLGFSLAAGFNNHIDAADSPLFVTGAPRGGNTGQVVMFEKVNINNELLMNITNILNGEVLGSAFGYDLEIVDVSGDDRSDLVVGAPHYYDREAGIGGAVYVFVNKGSNKADLGPNATVILYGESESGFGTSITTLGDINMDGFNDIAIGAPSADQGIGRVYVYHGSSTGINEKPSQILIGKNLFLSNNVNVTGFGYSLSGGLDMDLNGYPDLVVGSLSDAAFLYRSRPIVNINGKIFAAIRQININPNSNYSPNIAKIVPAENKTVVLSFNLSICMDYQSIPLTFDEHVNVSYTVKLDVMKLDKGLRPRVSFFPLKSIGIKTDTILLYPQSTNKMACDSLPLYLDNNMQDKLSPFVFSLSFDVVNKNITENADVPSLDQYPISNKNIADTVFTQVNISKNCGEDEICQSDLQMDVEYVVLLDGKSKWEPLSSEGGLPVLFAGTEKEIGIKAEIYNVGEDAHQAKLKLVYPEYLSFIGVTPSVSWNFAEENSTLIIFELGNPFRQESEISLIFRFGNDERLYEVNQFSLSLALSTSSEQTQQGFLSYAVSVRVQAGLKIDGYATADQIKFSGKVVGESAVRKPEDAGLFISHEYEIENTGRSEAGPVIVSVDWPYAMNNGKWLFYLLSYKVTGSFFENDAVCQVSPDFLDPLNINEEQQSFRSKREINITSTTSSKSKKSSLQPSAVRLDTQNQNVELLCPDTAHCTSITCNLGTMISQQKLYFNISGVVWNSTFIEEFNGTIQVKVFSSATIHVNRTNILYSSSSIRKDTVITSILSEEIIVDEYHAEWWIIALATTAGVLLLVIIVIVLWRCGFFKRKWKHEDYHKAHKHRQASKKADESSQQFVFD